MNYRPAEQRDREAIREILIGSFNPIYAYFAKRSFVSLHNALVAEDGSRVVGVVNWRIFHLGREKISSLPWLAVHPDYRRMGIGKSLILKAIGNIDGERDPVDIYVAVEKKNLLSQRLFVKTGFSLVSRSAIRKKYRLRRFRLYFRMMLAPREDLFIRSANRSH
jgi:ribosomal protein S18 acetylase RimI-like enzyme